MNTRHIGAVIVVGLVGLVAAACGGASDGDRAEAVDLFVDAMATQQIDVDRDCADRTVAQLSDEDVSAILDAGGDKNATLSPEGEEITTGLLDCVDTTKMIDMMVDDLVAEIGPDNVDSDCLRKAFGGIDLADPQDPAISAAMLDCVSSGG